VIGLLFWAGFVFQTSGLDRTTPSRSAFITGLSVPLTPIVYLAVHGRRPRVSTILGVVLALAGMWLLTRPEPGTALNRGDLLTLGCAVAFAGQIVAAGHFGKRVSARHLLVVELAVTGVLSLLTAPLLETTRIEPSLGLAGLIAFLSLSAVATFGFQLRAQQVVSPSQTALIFALEPVFAAITSYVAIGEVLTPAQWGGGALIVAAMLLPELGAFKTQPTAERG
jgi:drug/metabolite transporter (DMT)-like permease